MKLVLFDIDGTLLNAAGASKIAYTRAFESIYGIQDVCQNIEFHGRTDPLILQECAHTLFGRTFSEHECTQLYEAFYVAFEEELLNPEHTFEVLPGALELCKELSEREDIVMGLETGNLQRTAFMKLRHASLAHYFSFGGFSSDNSERSKIVALAIKRASKHSNGKDFHPSEVIVIGDAVQDAQAAKENGCKMVGVSTGGYSAEALHAAGADEVVANLLQRDQILKVINSSS